MLPLDPGPLQDGSFEPVVVNSIQRNRVPCLTVKGNQAASLGKQQFLKYKIGQD